MARKKHLALGVFVLALIYSWQVLGLHKAWYIEDDPYLYAFVSRVANPLQFFFDKTVVESPEVRYLIGANYTPAHFAAMWFDNLMAVRQPAFAYAHTALVLAFTSGLLFYLLSYFLPWFLALTGCVAFLLLPGTIVVTNFLSTRHYLQSLCLALAGVVLVLYQGKGRPGFKTHMIYWVGAFLVSFSAFFKEVSIFPALFILLGLFVWRRRWTALPALIIFPLAWVIIRWSMVGFSPHYPGSPQSLSDVWRVVSAIPSILVSHPAGYGLLLFLVPIFIFAVRKPRFGSGLTLWILVILASLLPIIPACMNLLSGTANTWHRLFFVPGLVLVVALLHGIASIPSTKGKSLLALVLLGILLIPFPRNNSYWRDLQRAHKKEGLLYLEPKRVLVESRVAAFWFLDGVHRYFTPNEPIHYLTQKTPAKQREEMIQKYGPAVDAGVP